MSNSIEEFKGFVQKYPRLKFEVRDGKRSWQSIYEEWTLLGDDGSWDNYKNESAEKSKGGEGQELLQGALRYIKKLNPDDISRYLGMGQKVLGLFQSFGGGKKVNYTPRRRMDPLFRRFDDYDE